MPVPRALPFLLALAAAIGAVAPLMAQTVVTGQVTDSLAGRPFAGASVQLVPAAAPWSVGHATISDSAGRFRLDSVAAGTYTFGFTHPRLDSLGVDAITRTVTVGANVTSLDVSLALPGATTLARAFCGVRNDTTGVVFGRVRDAGTNVGSAGARVTARWGELVLGQRDIRPVTSQVSARSAEDGRYVLCGVPVDVAVSLQVSDANSAAVTQEPARRSASGAIEVSFPDGTPVLHRDLLLATARESASVTATARLTGTVVSPDGVPVPGARARIGDGATVSNQAVTDSLGGFTLAGVPAGTQTLQVIAIGFSPTRVAVDLQPGVSAVVTVRMRERVTTLEPVKVYGVLSRDAREYAARAQRGGAGFFMTGDDVRKRGQQLVSAALLRAPGLRLLDTQFGRPVIGGAFRCTPRFFLDGWEIANDEIDRFISPETLGGIEVYRQAAEVPPTLMRGLLLSPEGREPCSFVFLWSRAVVP